MKCVVGSASGGQYVIQLNITSYDSTKIQDYANSLSQSLTSEGWTITQTSITDDSIYIVMSRIFDSTNIMVLLQVQIASDQAWIGVGMTEY